MRVCTVGRSVSVVAIVFSGRVYVHIQRETNGVGRAQREHWPIGIKGAISAHAASAGRRALCAVKRRAGAPWVVFFLRVHAAQRRFHFTAGGKGT